MTSSVVLVKGICPKCNKLGNQRIHKDAKSPALYYLEYTHYENSKTRVCHIGRVRTGEEAMAEFNEPETIEDYKKALQGMTNEIRELIKKCNTYSEKSRVPVPLISQTLSKILKKHGY